MKYPVSLIRRPANTLTRFSYKLFVVSIIALLISLPIPSNVLYAAAGNLDLTFGNGGKVFSDFSSTDIGMSVAIQADEKIVVTGQTTRPLSTSESAFIVVRYNSNGTLDSSFGNGGKVFTEFSDYDIGTAVAVQSDGKIIVAGGVGRFGLTYGIARYNSDGSLDSSFANAGKFVLTLSGVPLAIAIQSDGKILVTGSANNDFAALRLSANGVLDNSFGVGGIVQTDFGGNDMAEAIRLQPNGQIILGGITGIQFYSSTYNLALARYNSDGMLDQNFGSNGKVITDYADGQDELRGLDIQPDGKIVAGCDISGNDGIPKGAAVRYNSNGSLDITFGTGGIAFTSLTNRQRIIGVKVQPNGRIVIAGTLSTTDASFMAAKFNTDGTPDQSFGVKGQTSADIGTFDVATGMALQPNGKIVVVGYVFGGDRGGNYDIGLVRFENTITPQDFDICMQDDSGGNLLQFNSTTGDYQFSNCRKGWSFTGRGTVTVNSCKMRFTAADVNGSISALANTCTNVGTASVQVNSQGRTFTISDRDMRNNSCGCQ